MKNYSPLVQYNDAVENGEITSDPLQLHAVRYLDRLYSDISKIDRESVSLLEKIGKWFGGSKTANQKGIYLWGTVGSGKTYLVDSFFECLPVSNKLRIHFHRFMQRIHNELKQVNNMEDPLQHVADSFAAQYQVICFDEFHVSDITDAMLLGKLLEAFIDRNIIFITTSNTHPDNLYKNGLQRSRFLPAIELIKRHMEVIELSSDVDYRLRYLGNAELYHYPLDDAAEQMMLRNFQNIAPNTGRSDSTIEIENRKIQTICCADGVVWFDFSIICNSPRGPADYIEIARQFQTVLIQNVPRMSDDMNDQAKRFVTLIDEFYDRNVKLVISAEVAIQQLYQGRRLEKEFQRTQSRLMQMRNIEYLGRQHISD
ncbi:MAG: cell division protein ZapE [Gammaproteobacteria bacterium]|nr:cell division protein ZapE [Gammaproteobacteria bacterium]